MPAPLEEGPFSPLNHTTKQQLLSGECNSKCPSHLLRLRVNGCLVIYLEHCDTTPQAVREVVVGSQQSDCSRSCADVADPND
jgi:hypothetical protein